MKEMGFGGYNMHPRVGLETPYLSDEFMDIVRFCTEKGKKNGMFSWLYDEDKWPSGYAGGFVTSDVEMRRKKLFVTPIPYDDGSLTLDEDKKKQRQLCRRENMFSSPLMTLSLTKKATLFHTVA